MLCVVLWGEPGWWEIINSCESRAFFFQKGSRFNIDSWNSGSLVFPFFSVRDKRNRGGFNGYWFFSNKINLSLFRKKKAQNVLVIGVSIWWGKSSIFPTAVIVGEISTNRFLCLKLFHCSIQSLFFETHCVSAFHSKIDQGQYKNILHPWLSTNRFLQAKRFKPINDQAPYIGIVSQIVRCCWLESHWLLIFNKWGYTV